MTNKIQVGRLSLALFLLASCTTTRSQEFDVTSPSSETWRRASQNTDGLTFRSLDGVASLGVHSKCQVKTKEDLRKWRDVYVGHLPSYTVLHDASFPLGKHEAHVSTIEGFFSGQRMILTMVLLQVNDCIFDLSLLADPDDIDRFEPDLFRLAASIQF